MNQRSISRKLFPLLILISILFSGCTADWLGSLLPQQSAPGDAVPLVEVTFYVQIPQNTPEDEALYLSTLDEVTGLGVNAEAHLLEPAIGADTVERGLLYQTTLTVPLHSTIKYRYTRQNQYAVIEHTSTGDQVRYRMVEVDAPIEIRDIVYSWSDTEYFWPEPGRISGTITDSNSGSPIPGILVTAGGVQTFTTANGSYLLSNLPPGVHNLVAYSIDGRYQTNQQGAEVASQANTEAILSLTPREFVDVTFLVTVPYGTPENSVRLAGNLYQLGNTFGNLSGGMNTIPTRMPQLLNAEENRYGIILSLPVGAEIFYKYTLGDGFWNAEHGEDGDFKVRRFMVPSEATTLNDSVLTWSSGNKQSITLDLFTPEHTPAGEEIYVQFNPYGWTTPLPMTEISANHWVFILYSPLEIVSDLTYRYCREGQCGVADDAATSGTNAEGRNLQAQSEPQYIADTIQNWAWLEKDLPADLAISGAGDTRDGSFLTAVEVMPGEDPSHTQKVIKALPAVAELGPEWVVFTPTWSFTHQQPPVLEPDPNQDPLWSDLNQAVAAAEGQALKIALFPQPHFPDTANSWWESSARDFSWWNSWFDQYAAYAFHFAETAEELGVETLVLGGEWLAPALPGGKLGNGNPSGVPADADLRWNKILTEVDERFSGKLAWTMAVPEEESPPRYFEHLDQIYLNCSPALSSKEDQSRQAMLAAANGYLDSEIKPFHDRWIQAEEKELVLRISYPSVSGGSSACIPSGGEKCLAISNFYHPAPVISNAPLDLMDQAKAYDAILSAAASKDWVSGVVSRGYYAPTVLHDLSISTHGKPADRVLKAWFSTLHP